MSRNRIEDFGPYQDAVVLCDHVVHDMAILQKDPRCYRLIAQQVASADSICANMDEGFGRLSRTEFIRFLDFSRGSARETLGRYKRLKHWLSPEVIAARVDLADKIIAKLTITIQTLRANYVARDTRHSTPDTSHAHIVRDPDVTYDISRDKDAEEITEKEIELLLGIE